MKADRMKFITPMIIAVFLCSCTKSVLYLSPNEVHQIKAGSRVTVETQDGETIQLRNPKIGNQTLIGEAKDRG